MLLAIDIGNTNVKIGVFDGDELVQSLRLSTVQGRTGDEYGMDIVSRLRANGISASDITGAIMSSVNPGMNYTFEHACDYFFGVKPLNVGSGIKTGLVSNRQFARNPAEYLGIADKFDVIIGLEDVTHAKPDPEPLLTALSRLGVEPAQAVYVGDTDIDMKTAAAAGVRGIGVTTGNFGAEQHLAAGAWRVCGSLAEAAALCGVEPRK